VQLTKNTAFKQKPRIWLSKDTNEGGLDLEYGTSRSKSDVHTPEGAMSSKAVKDCNHFGLKWQVLMGTNLISELCNAVILA
jgi:hypothetical protein